MRGGDGVASQALDHLRDRRSQRRTLSRHRIRRWFGDVACRGAVHDGCEHRIDGGRLARFADGNHFVRQDGFDQKAEQGIRQGGDQKSAKQVPRTRSRPLVCRFRRCSRRGAVAGLRQLGGLPTKLSAPVVAEVPAKVQAETPLDLETEPAKPAEKEKTIQPAAAKTTADPTAGKPADSAVGKAKPAEKPAAKPGPSNVANAGSTTASACQASGKANGKNCVRYR